MSEISEVNAIFLGGEVIAVLGWIVSVLFQAAVFVGYIGYVPESTDKLTGLVASVGFISIGIAILLVSFYYIGIATNKMLTRIGHLRE